METKTTNSGGTLLPMDENILFLPGDCILQAEQDMIASTGTYLKNGYIFASLAGYARIEQISEKLNTVPKAEAKIATAGGNVDMAPVEMTTITKRVVRVECCKAKKVPFLEPGSVVTCRVLRISSNTVRCSINCIEDYVLKQPYTGLIRAEDVREFYDKERMSLIRNYRPGDIILARVFCSSDNHQFLLTTAAPELGVVIATNDRGEALQPISVDEVFDRRTLTKEPRKVAKLW